MSQPLSPDQSLNSVNYAFEANDELFAFASIRPATEEAMRSPDVLSLAKITPDGQINLLRTDSYLISEGLGATDGSGAIIVDIQDWQPSGPYPWGKLRWLGSDNSPAVDLQAEGSHLRWGK